MNNFNLFIKYTKTYVIQINNSIKLNELRNMISEKINIPKEFFYITFGGKILDHISLITLNPTIEELNNISDSYLPFIKPDSTIYIMIYSRGPSFIKKLYDFICDNGYTVNEFKNIKTSGLELDKLQITISKHWQNS